MKADLTFDLVVKETCYKMCCYGNCTFISFFVPQRGAFFRFQFVNVPLLFPDDYYLFYMFGTLSYHKAE